MYLDINSGMTMASPCIADFFQNQRELMNRVAFAELPAVPLGTAGFVSTRVTMDTPCFWVYILENAAGKFYVGSSDDPDRRLLEHNDTTSGRDTFTHKNGPWRLVWEEPHLSRSAAVVRERQIKSMKSAVWIRTTLLNGGVATRRDLRPRKQPVTAPIPSGWNVSACQAGVTSAETQRLCTAHRISYY